MHSQHATSAAQDALDALICKYPPSPLAITSTEVTTIPPPDSPGIQDTTLPDAPTTTAPVEKDGWKTVEGKAAQRKRRNDKADNKRDATTINNTPIHAPQGPPSFLSEHCNGDPPLRSPQPPLKSSIFPSNSDSPHSVTLFWKFPEYYT
jgi:hypothetical protein